MQVRLVLDFSELMNTAIIKDAWEHSAEDNLDPREWKQQKGEENCIVRSFIMSPNTTFGDKNYKSVKHCVWIMSSYSLYSGFYVLFVQSQ
jgi:hypothetical protein